jgi:hypothetical protein
MREICSIKNKEIFELKKKCKVVQDNINNNIKKEDQKEESKKNEVPRIMQN